jgi:hypothetical protein
VKQKQIQDTRSQRYVRKPRRLSVYQRCWNYSLDRLVQALEGLRDWGYSLRHYPTEIAEEVFPGDPRWEHCDYEKILVDGGSPFYLFANGFGYSFQGSNEAETDPRYS